MAAELLLARASPASSGAPFSRSSCTTLALPLAAAECSGVYPYCRGRGAQRVRGARAAGIAAHMVRDDGGCALFDQHSRDGLVPIRSGNVQNRVASLRSARAPID